MDIPFTQFLMPNGTKRKVIITRPNDIAVKAQRLLDAGCRLEIEMLQTGEISMTVERDGEEQVLAHEICNNGPEVPIAVDKLISEAVLDNCKHGLC